MIPTRVFAAVMSSEEDIIYPNENEPRPGGKGTQTQNSAREVQVAGSAEVSYPADLATVRISISNNKESVNDVTNSISRRVEYILQALRQHDVKEENTTVTKHIHRDDDLYHMDAEVTVVFSDFVKMERVCSVLLEKLDKSVCVGSPQFHHSAPCLSLLRRRACVAAVENARLKASEVSSLLGQTLGLPLLVREEEVREWKNEEERDRGEERNLPRPPHRPTITASSRMFVSFSLRPRQRARKKL